MEMARVQSAISFLFLLVGILAVIGRAEEEEDSGPSYGSIAKCFDPCYEALDFAERAGKVPQLCGKGSIFEGKLSLCIECLNHSNVHKTASQLLGENLDGYLKYCDGVDLEMQFGKDPSLTVDPTFTPTAIPTVRPCLTSICEMTVDRWLTFVTYPEVYKTYAGCKTASDQGEIYALARCGATAGCVNGGVPSSVEKLADKCRLMVLEEESKAAAASASDTATETASETETATATTSALEETSSILIAPEILTETISATVTAAVKKTQPKANVAGVVAVTVGVCALTVLAIGAGIFVFLRRRRSLLQDMPHPPRPFSDLWGTPERRSELPGHHNRWKSIAERRSELPAGGHWKIIQEMEGSPCSPVELMADERKLPRIAELKA